jgi:uncharacterized membrane protein YcaP (DUF421 family)
MDTIRALIGPDTGEVAIWQFCVRAVVIFTFGVFCIRLAGRRTFSQYSPLDIVVYLLVGSNLSRTMTGKADFFGGLAATLVIVVLHRLLALATLRWRGLARLVKGEPRVLIRDGAIDRTALVRHGLSDADLAASLRLEGGVERAEDVHIATIETGGRISVVQGRKEQTPLR